MSTSMIRVTKSSGNVFRDIALPEPEVLQAKADLLHRISGIIKERRLSQTAAARILGVAQPKISALLHGRIDGFSIERLVRFLNALDQDVRISIRPKARRRAIIRVA
ncbi:MAG: helix-turn-helix domain-containing protein [Candidatus Binataceae bacterium]